MADPETGLNKLKGALAALAEPALIFAATGSKAAAVWGGLKAVIIGNVLGPLSLVSGALIGIVGSLKVFVGRLELVSKGIDKLRSLEMIKTQFEPLLGGAALAQKRLEELYQFASSTPFQLEGLAEANRTLQVLTKGALATTEGMKLVGDAAAVTGQSMQTVSFWVGRFYDGLKSGAPIGEAATRLQEMGLISGDTRRKIEASTKAGDAFTDTFAILEKELKKSEGGMEALSQTLGGLESTLADAKSAFAGSFAKNFFEAEKASTKAMINVLQLFEPVMTRLGEVFSMVATAVSKFFVIVSGGQDGFQRLGNNLKYALDIFLAFGAAVAANQIATLVGAFARAGTSALSFATAVELGAIKAAFAGAASQGLRAQLMAAGGAFLGLSAKAKVAAVAQLGFAGATKVATVVLGMFRQAVSAAFAAMGGPIGLMITGIIAVAMAFRTSSKNAEEAAAVTKKVKKEFQELKQSIDESIASIKKFDDTLAVFEKLGGNVTDITNRVQGLSEKAGGIGTMGLSMGEGRVVLDEIDSLIEGYDMIISKIYEVGRIAERDLELGKQKRAQLEQELSLRQQLKQAAIDAAMANASEAEQIAIMSRQRGDTSQNLALAETSQDSLVNKESFERSDNRRGQKADIEAMEAMQERTKAEMARAEALIAMGETVFGDDLTLFGIEIESLEQAKRVIISKKEQQKEYVKMIKEAKDALDAESASATGSAGVTGNLVDSIDLGDPTSMIFPDDLFPMGALAAFQERLKDTEGLTSAQREKLEMAVKRMKDAAKETANLKEEQQRLNDRMAEMQRIQERTVALFQLEQQLHAANMAIDLQGFQVSKKQQDIRLAGLQKELAIQQKLGDSQKSIEDMQARQKTVQGELAGTTDTTKREALEKELATIKEQLEIAQATNKETTKLQNEIDKLGKEIEKAAVDLARTVANIFDDIEKELRQLNIDEAFQVGDFGAAMRMIQEDTKRNEERIQADRLQALKAQGVEENDAKKIVADEAANREKRRENERNAIRVNSDRENQKAQLQMQANVFGDGDAKKQLQAMDDQDFFRQKLEQNLRAGMGDLEAQAFAQQDLDSKLMREAPEMKVMADSFRRIGAGGAAASTDPMKILAERRLRVQELIQKDINTLMKEVVAAEDGQVRLKKA